MPLDQAHHYSAPDVFGNRASFRTVTDPACLFVDEVRRNDEGVYRCRVDFRNSATKSFRYNLSVIGKWSSIPILWSNSYKHTKWYFLSATVINRNLVWWLFDKYTNFFFLFIVCIIYLFKFNWNCISCYTR